jgi:hypothetical protein
MKRFPGQAVAQIPRSSFLRVRAIMSRKNLPAESVRIWGRRAFVAAGLLLAASPAFGKRLPRRPLRILFVCQFGTAKSAIAREIFKRKARERGMAIDVFSRGITLADHVSPPLRQRLDAEGIDTNAQPATVLAPQDWRRADMVIAFNPLPTGVKRSDIRDWSDVPSLNDDYVNARAILDKRLDALLDELLMRGR